jgi:hypothetical protein
MPHIYYDGFRMAMQFDPLTNTKQGDCIPGCLRVDGHNGTPLMRIPVSKLPGDLMNWVNILQEVLS